MKQLLILVSTLLTPFAAESVASDYAIVVSRQTLSATGWKPVVDALKGRHETATIITWQQAVSECLESLQKQHPRYTCFVATSAETGRDFVADVHRLTRRFDDDSYTDTQWGILTGYDAANAQKIAEQNEPLTIHKTASGTELAVEMCSQVVCFDELVKNKKVSRQPDGELKQEHGPDDTTRALADTLTEDGADLFVTSGHATERDWQIGFRYRNGQFRSQAGQMFGVPLSGERFSIRSEHPRIYLPIGNCLMGHIDGPDAMALAWMNSVGVRQMIGYTVVTWYGYGGWGVLDYFVEQPGRYTLTEAFHANHHALIHRLETAFGGAAATEVTVGDQRVPTVQPNKRGRTLGLTAQDGRGLLWDRDAVAFYGDPAWSARMEKQLRAFEQTLTIDKNVYAFTITPQRGEASFDPVNTNGSQRGGRPMVEFLPHRVNNVKIVTGEEFHPVVTDDFILFPNPRECDPSETYRVTFTADVIE